MLHFLFPSSPIEPKQPEPLFEPQQMELERAGFTWSLCSDERIAGDRALRNIPAGATVVYRGWMLKPEEYGRLTKAMCDADVQPLTDESSYSRAHYLPNWYPLIPDSTPETVVVPSTADFASVFRELRWGAYFLKDYVKSLKTATGSIVATPEEASKVLEEMTLYRGEIEGGVCIRRVEEFVPGSETRYFVIDGVPHGPSDSVPKIVADCATRIPSRFFSVDVAHRTDGVARIIEVGDGQVSDLVGWSPQRFAQIWIEWRNRAA